MRDEERSCLLLAMEAKELVFKAQDAADRIRRELLRLKVKKILAAVRSDLERLDNLLRWNEEGPGE